MDYKIEKYKGIPPGKIIARKLLKLNLSQRALSTQTQIHYQTINAIIKGKRKITLEQSQIIGNRLGFDTGFLYILQTYFDVIRYEELTLPRRLKATPPKIRKVIFWDVDYDTLDWIKYRDFIVERVNQRGSAAEKKEIALYYESLDKK